MEQPVEMEVGGQLTKVRLIGASLELDSSGARLYQEMPHQLMGHVPWDEEKEMKIITPRSTLCTSQQRLITSPVSVV